MTCLGFTLLDFYGVVGKGIFFFGSVVSSGKVVCVCVCVTCSGISFVSEIYVPAFSRRVPVGYVSTAPRPGGGGGGGDGWVGWFL